jgi:NAD-dependent dihydropyrimidine dehydrogenase PreA subunit
MHETFRFQTDLVEENPSVGNHRFRIVVYMIAEIQRVVGRSTYTISTDTCHSLDQSCLLECANSVVKIHGLQKHGQELKFTKRLHCRFLNSDGVSRSGFKATPIKKSGLRAAWICR